MTVGTEGNDTLVNDTTISNEVVDARSGDDIIYVTEPTTLGSSVTVLGGEGFDTLRINARFHMLQGIGYDGSAVTRPTGSQNRPLIQWESIEQLEIIGSLLGSDAWFATGDSIDILRFSSLAGSSSYGSALLFTAGGDDDIRLGGEFFRIDVAAGTGNDIIDLGNVQSVAGTIFANGNDGDDHVIGSRLNDALYGGAGNDRLDGGLGADILYGGDGDDIYIANQVGDAVGEFADEGTDEIRTELASYSLQDYIHVENLTLLRPGDVIASGNERANRITGSIGDNTIYGLGGDDTFLLHLGGTDRAFGGSGRDIFYFGAEYRGVDDPVDGGSEVDQLVLQGDYSGVRAITLPALPGFEQMFVLSGSDNRFGAGGSALLSYDIATTQETLAPGQILYVNASSLRAGETHRFNGAAETDGGIFYLYGSLGTDLLTGGSGGDAFLFSGVDILNVNDAVDGGGGYDHLLLRGSYAPVTFTATTITNVERVALLSGNDPNMGPILGDLSYHFTLNDANVPAGAEFFLDASNLGVGEWALLNASGDYDGRVRLIGGRGNDILIGGLGNDSFEGGGGADTLQDGSGDATYVYRDTSDSVTTYRDRVNGFNAGDKFDMSAMDAISGTPENDAFTFIGAGAFTGQAGQLRAFVAPDGITRIEGDVTGDGVADFAIDVSLGGSGFVFQSGDFIL